jgi:flavorubredoxin
MFALLNPIRDKGKKAAAFGSYGWSGEAVKIIEDHLRNLKLKVIDGMGAKFYPNNSKVEDIIQFAKSFSTEIA